MDEDDRNYVLKAVIEIHRNISAANVYIQSYHEYSNKLKIVVYSDSIFVSLYMNGRTVHNLKLRAPTDFFIPTSFYSTSGFSGLLKKEEDCSIVEAEYVGAGYRVLSNYTEGNFRLQINCPDPGGDEEVEYNYSRSVLYPQKIETNAPYIVFCVRCHYTLVESVTFKIICSMDTLELSENWYCHKRDCVQDVGDQKADELYYNSTCYILRCLKAERLIEEDYGTVYRCKCCSSVISSTKRQYGSAKDIVFCFKDKIMFRKLNELSPEPVSLENVGLISLLNIIKSTFETAVTCKLYLGSKGDIVPHKEPRLQKLSLLDESCLLIIVVDNSMKYFNLKQSHFNIDSEEDIELTTMIKVLFCSTVPTTEIARSWLLDIAVDYHNISDSMMKEITTYLSNSAKNAPSVKGLPPNFSIAYLPTCIPPSTP